MFFGSVNRLYPIGCVCVLLRGSSDRHSGCWNKKSRPRTLTKSSHLFSSFQHLTRSLSLFLVTLACFPLVTTATKTNAIASTQTPSSVHSHNNTNVASQNDMSDFFVSFNLQQTQMITVLAQNMTVGYLNALMDDFGTNGSIGKEQLSQMIEKIIRVYKQDEDAEHRDHNTKSGGDVDFSSCSRYSMNGTSLNYSMGKDEQSLDPNQLLSCQVNKCMNADSIFQLYNLTDDYRLTRPDLLLLTPLILKQIQTCQLKNEEIPYFSKSTEAWAYGFLFVTVINICALVGVVVLPIMNTRIYKKVLLFLVALAVGSLAGSGLLVLIPEAFEIVGTREDRHAYLWMGTTIMSGIYLFFLIERFLKIVFEWKMKRKSASEADYDIIMDKNENRQIECATDELSDIVCSVKSKTPVDLDTAKMKDPANYHASASQCTSHLSRTESVESVQVKLQKKSTPDDGLNLDVPNGCLHTRLEGKKKKTIRTVAWMIIFGDGLHNFIDGLSIGAAFTANIMTGVSVSVAVICEELPHELGDFAILLNAGMSMKQALCFNFLSACMCYIGLIFGILLAEATAAHTWIFGVAGGMFLYISLVDMVPEMNQVVEAKENKELGITQLFILQNIGMIIGFGIILIISLYAEDIKFGS